MQCQSSRLKSSGSSWLNSRWLVALVAPVARGWNLRWTVTGRIGIQNTDTHTYIYAKWQARTEHIIISIGICELDRTQFTIHILYTIILYIYILWSSEYQVWCDSMQLWFVFCLMPSCFFIFVVVVVAIIFDAHWIYTLKRHEYEPIM